MFPVKSNEILMTVADYTPGGLSSSEAALEHPVEPGVQCDVKVLLTKAQAF
jgi:hypothetical protein